MFDQIKLVVPVVMYPTIVGRTVFFSGRHKVIVLFSKLDAALAGEMVL